MASKVEIEKIYGLSPMQEGMLFHSLYNQESNAYFQQSVLSIDGSIDRHAIEQSVQALVDQYDIFRTIFRYQKVKKPIQVVLKNRKAQVFFEDISMLEEKSQREALEALCNQDREKGFDLSKDLLMRVTLVKINEETTKLIWSFHHILMDGWCLGLIIHHFFDLYQSYKNGTIPDKMNIPPYHRYIEWLEKQNQHEALDYWQNILEGYDALATIPSNQTKTDEQGIYQKGEHAFLLDQQTTKQLVDLSHTYQVTVNSVFQAIWGILLQRYNNTNDVVFGAVVSGRPAQVKEVERIVGLFINTIPVRVSYEAKTRFSELIQAVQQAGLEAERYSYVPLYDIQAKHPLKQGLLDHIIGFQNYPVHQKVQLDSQDAIDFEVTDMEVFEQTNYDFNLQVIQEETITIKLLYNAHLLSRDLIHNIENHFNQLVQCILEAPERVVGEIPIVSAEEERQLLEELNGLNSEGDQKRHEAKSASTLTELFELQAEKTPHKTALVFKDQSMTYTELNQKANQLAHYLRLKGVKPEMTVGLMVERSFEMIIGILAILKAGGAYLPLAPTLPAERLEYMFKDSQTTLLLTQKHFSERLFFDGEIVYLDEPISYQESTDPLPVINQPADLAYMIYTSGSTGQPKGTCITHENVYQFVQDSSFIQITEEDRVLQILNFIFDGSVFDIFGSLLHGATLVLIEEAILLDMNQLADVIKREEISLFLITSALFNTLVEYNLNSLTGVRKILFGGEKASVRHVYRAFKHLGPGKLVNVYGPTEATVISTSYTIEQLNGQESSIPIGQPVSSACAYVLNQQLQLQPLVQSVNYV
ncbi:non-ribosomal peptide synthetase [Caldalkalibacillus mannanilyticus]|uniref:non-ribosomal peptide synthetase n=1 Tax=Caldalkalibacillus mannanilyticus TaxID=1418 RepID=UPI0006881A1B